MKSILILLLTLSLFADARTEKSTTILCIGDSITEGAKKFKSYRQYLVPSLIDKGIDLTFIGPKKDAISAHSGYSGKNTGFLLSKITEIYTAHPADIVLIHAGHNRFNKNNPVPSILDDTQKIIQAITKINPKAKILLAQTITAGKLPKYAYIPKLNLALPELVTELKKQNIQIELVDHATGFDHEKHTIADQVHPNTAGAKHIADRWLKALLPLLGHHSAKEITTLTLGKLSTSTEKRLPNGRVSHVSSPSLDVYLPMKPNGASLVIVSGGGYKKLASGPLGLAFADAFLKKGFTIFSLKYRLSPPSKNVVKDACQDGSLALQLIRSRAKEWNLDIHRIGMIGYSAGANLILNLACDQKNESPNFIVLANLWRHQQPKITDFDLHRNLPPTMILTAEDDKIAPTIQAKRLAQALQKLNVSTQLEIYPTGGHMGFNLPNPKNTKWIKQFNIWFIKSFPN